MTWAVRTSEGPVGILDLPVSLAAMVCETAGCTWERLDPSGQPGHLAAVVAGALSWRSGEAFDALLIVVAAKPLSEALEFLEVDGAAD